jgi:hypothetical protein
VEPGVGAGGPALAGEHPGGVLVVPLGGEHAGGEGEPPRQVLRPQEPHQLAPVLEAGQRHPGHEGAGQRLAGRAVGAGEAVAVLLPGGEQGSGLVADPGAGLGEQRLDVVGGPAGGGEALGGGLELVDGSDGLGLVAGGGVVGPDGLGDLGEVALPRRRDEDRHPGRGAGVDAGQRPLPHPQAGGGEAVAQLVVEGRDPVVVEAGGDRAEDRQLLQPVAPAPVAADLAADVAQRVLGPPAVELVDGHDVGQLEHVDLLELGGGAVLGGHDVEGDVGQVDDRRVALPDAGRLDDHQVVAGGPAGGDHAGHGRRQLGGRGPGADRAEVDLVGADAVHADAVAEQGAARAPPVGVDGQHGDPQLVLLVAPQPQDELVGEGRLARPARAGDAEHRGLPAGGQRVEPLGERVGEDPVLDGGEHGGQRPARAAGEVVDRLGGPWRDVALAHDGVDHGVEPEALAVRGREDPHPDLRQSVDLGGDDDAPAAPVDADVADALLGQALDQVGEVLDVPALVAADRHRGGVLVEGGPDDLVDRAVVAQVDDLGALGLE